MGGRLSGAEQSVWESAERCLKHHPDLVVVILHLSRLVAPAPRPYHIRIARALLQDAATRFSGQVFAMRNQDMILLARPGPTQAGKLASAGTGPVAHAPEVLPNTLERLFSASLSPDTQLTSMLRSNAGMPTLLNYLAACTTAVGAVAPVPQYDPVLSLKALHAILDQAPLAELLVLRTGMRLAPDRHTPLADRLALEFQSLRFSFSAFALDPLVAQAIGDPFLFGHLAAGLDRRLMELLSDDMARGGALTRCRMRAVSPVQVELGPATILSQDFARLARQAIAIGRRFDVAMTLMQASADLALLDEARRVLATSGSKLVITQVQPHQLLFANPASLGAGLVKLTWSSRLLGQEMTGRMALGLSQLDPARTVLEGVDSPLALEWGQARGLVLYEGAFLDQVQAAHRMGACDHAAECSMGQSRDQARAATGWGRTGCRNAPMRDAGCTATSDLERAA